MELAVLEAVLVIDRPLDRQALAVFAKTLVAGHSPPDDPLIPLPYAREFWNKSKTTILSNAPMIGLRSEVAYHGDSAWAISLQGQRSDSISALVFSVDLPRSRTAMLGRWDWFVSFIGRLAADEAISFALVNASSNNHEQIAGEGLPGLGELTPAIPPTIGAWFYISDTRLASIAPEAGRELATLATDKLAEGLVFNPSPDFIKPIPPEFLAAFERVSGVKPVCYQASTARWPT